MWVTRIYGSRLNGSRVNRKAFDASCSDKENYWRRSVPRPGKDSGGSYKVTGCGA